MKVQLIKKSFIFSLLFVVCTGSVQAQMLDLMGSMAVGGAQSVESARSLGRMNKALRSNQFLSQLQFKIAEISTTYFGNYQSMSIQSFNENGLKVVFRPVNNGQNFEAFISPVNQGLCQTLLTTRFENLIEYRLMSGGSFQNYKPAQAASNTSLCVTVNAVSLILQ